MELKPQDLVVALKILTKGEAKWSQRDLAQCLGMSLSEVNGAIQRAIRAGLLIAVGSRNKSPRAVPYALTEFIKHGVRYSFPIERGSITRGVPSGLAGARLGDASQESGEHEIRVWPSPHGKVRGIGINPLYKSIPEIAEKEENRDLYSLLSLVDAIREGRARERNLASDLLEKKIAEAPERERN